MSSIAGQIESEHPELFPLEFGKIAESDFVYSLASTNINQSKPNLVKMYVTIRSWMSSVMDLIKSELSECKYRPVSTKLGQNTHVQQNLNEFDHGSDWTGTTGVICF